MENIAVKQEIRGNKRMDLAIRRKSMRSGSRKSQSIEEKVMSSINRSLKLIT